MFDGRPPEVASARPTGLDVRYAGAGASADELIVMLVAEAEADEVTVVTSDRELARRATELSARVEGAGAFLHRTGLAR